MAVFGLRLVVLGFCTLFVFRWESEAKVVGRLRTLADEYGKLRDFPKQDIQEIRSFIKSDPTLPAINDLRIAQFHYAKFYQKQQTKEAIRTFYTLFRKHEEFSFDRKMDNAYVKNAKELLAIYASPVRAAGDRQIIFGKLLTSDMSKYNVYEIIKYGLMAIDASIQIYGVANQTEGVVDLKHATIEHFLPILGDPDLLKDAMKLVKAAPIRATALHVINAPGLAKDVLARAKQYIDPDYIKKVKIYELNEMDQFYRNVPKEVLPAEQRGTLGSLMTLKADFEADIKTVEGRFKEEEDAVDKAAKPKNEDD